MSLGQVGTVMCERFSEEVDGGKWYLVRWDGLEGCRENEIVMLNNGGPRHSPQNRIHSRLVHSAVCITAGRRATGPLF